MSESDSLVKSEEPGDVPPDPEFPVDSGTSYDTAISTDDHLDQRTSDKEDTADEDLSDHTEPGIETGVDNAAFDKEDDPISNPAEEVNADINGENGSTQHIGDSNGSTATTTSPFTDDSPDIEEAPSQGSVVVVMPPESPDEIVAIPASAGLSKDVVAALKPNEFDSLDEVLDSSHESEVSRESSDVAISMSSNASAFKSISLTWQDINVFVSTGAKKCQSCRSGSKQAKNKRILKNVYGVAQPGRTLAIMGASGAGKTSLLNVLTQQNLGNVVVDGWIKVNGHNMGSQIRTISAYVQQEDLFIGTLTVKEHMIFQALLRLGKDYSYKQRLKKVEDSIRELGLTKCQDTVIGVPHRIKGISGGEKKRLAFASEALTNPKLMFCDEPTSGLDSYMAQQVVAVLRQLSRRGKTIVATIHQPSSEVFRMFDDLCLLSEGRVAYVGPTKAAAKFFDKAGFPCPPKFNPADHYILTLAIVPGKEAECRRRVKKVTNTFASSDEFKAIESKVNNITDDKMGYASEYEWEDVFATTAKYKASWFQQFRAISWRSAKQILREPMMFRMRGLQAVVLSIMLGLVFLQTKLDGPVAIQNINGVLFQLVTAMVFGYMFTSINLFAEELPIFLRENKNSIYRTDTYFIAKSLSELPQFILFPAVFTAILYFLVGFRMDVTVFFICVGISILTANVTVSLGYFISSAAGDLTWATTIAPILIIPLMLFGGFFISPDTIPVWLNWLQYLSYLKYSYQAQVINMWSGVDSIPGCVGFNSTCPSNGDQVIMSMGFSKDGFAIDFVALAAMFVGLRILSFIALLMRSYTK